MDNKPKIRLLIPPPSGRQRGPCAIDRFPLSSMPSQTAAGTYSHSHWTNQVRRMARLICKWPQAAPRMNHCRPNIHARKAYGIAFGQAPLCPPPPARRRMPDSITSRRLHESGFGGWADEKIKIRLRRTKRLRYEAGKNQSGTFHNISFGFRAFDFGFQTPSPPKPPIHPSLSTIHPPRCAKQTQFPEAQFQRNLLFHKDLLRLAAVPHAKKQTQSNLIPRCIAGTPTSSPNRP